MTWGTNLYWASNDQALLTRAWWTFVPTGLGVALVGFSLALINFGLDEISNPRLSVERRWRSARSPRVELRSHISRRGAEMSTANTDTLLSVRDVSVSYLTQDDTQGGAQHGEMLAVKSVSFDLARGETLGLVGESGSGKSTLIGALLRTLAPRA